MSYPLMFFFFCIRTEVTAQRSWEINYPELQLVAEAGEGFYGAVFKGMREHVCVCMIIIYRRICIDSGSVCSVYV